MNWPRFGEPLDLSPELISGSSKQPQTPWTALPKPPLGGWWKARQHCSCPPCYFISLSSQISSGTLPLDVSAPLAQLIDIGVLRLNFKHSEHDTEFSSEDKEYCLAAYRDLACKINGAQCPRQLLEILLLSSKKGVFKAPSSEEPEWDRKEFEMCIKRALYREKVNEEDGKEHVPENKGKSEAQDSSFDSSKADEDDEVNKW